MSATAQLLARPSSSPHGTRPTSAPHAHTGAKRAPARQARRCALVCATALAVGWCAPGAALAQQAASAPAGDAVNLDLARNTAVKGREAFNAGDYETALALFRRAFTLFPAPTVVLYEARTLEQMGMLIEAVEAYSRTTQMAIVANAPAQFAEAVEAARQEGEALRVRIPTLTLEVRGASVADPNLTVTLNGRLLPTDQLGRAQNLNPGTYRVVGTVGANRRAQGEVTLVPGQNRRVELNLAPVTAEVAAPTATLLAAPSAETDTMSRRDVPALAYVAGGVGIAGITAGVVTGLMANSKYNEAEVECQEHRCTPGTPGPDAVDAFRTWRMVSSVSYGVGAVGIAAGVVLWLTASSDAQAGQVGSIEPWGNAKAAGIRGTF